MVELGKSVQYRCIVKDQDVSKAVDLNSLYYVTPSTTGYTRPPDPRVVCHVTQHR